MEPMNELASKLVGYVEAFEEAAINLAPDALELALTIVRLDSIGMLLTGAVVLSISLPLAILLARVAIREFEKYVMEQRDLMVFGGGIGSIILSITSLFSLILLLDFWNWVGAFAPHIKLARDVLERMI